MTRATRAARSSATASVGRQLALYSLLELVEEGTARTAPPPGQVPKTLPGTPNSPLTAVEAYAALSEVRPEGAIVVQESPSNYNEFLHWWPSIEPNAYYTMPAVA